MTEIGNTIQTEILNKFDAESTLIAFMISLACFLFLKLLVIITTKYYKSKEETSIVQVIVNRFQEIPLQLMLAVSLYISLVNSGIDINEDLLKITQVTLLIYIFYTIVRLVNLGIKDAARYLSKQSQNRSQKSAINYFAMLVRAGIWLVSIAIVLENLGLDVSALIAGLGISGFAVAFALRGAIGDLISSLILLLERNIELGDRIVVDGHEGMVSKIGIKTSKIKLDDGTTVLIPNGILTDKTVRNYSNDNFLPFSMIFTIKKTAKYRSPQNIVKELLRKEFVEEVKDGVKIYLNSRNEDEIEYKIDAKLTSKSTPDKILEDIMLKITDKLKSSKYKVLSSSIELE